MPVWWGRKSQKNKQEKQSRPSSIKKEEQHNTTKSKEKAKSFDDSLITSSPRTPKDFITSSSSFESDFDKKRGHPLPRPSVSSAPSQDHHGVVASASGSLSGASSASSSVSFNEDPAPHDFGFSNNHNNRVHTPRSRSPGPGSSLTETHLCCDPRVHTPRSRSPGPGSRSPGPGSRSPGPGSRSHTGTNLEALSGKIEDGRSLCHPLPLPPGSPTNPCTSPTMRNGVVSENSPFLRPKWKKGRLLGRGTFGHVYLGFNSESGQMCAIKEVKLISDDQSSKECLKQLNQEILLLGQLSHPNIVQYYGSELGEETLSVYLEFVSGGSIHKLLQEYGPFKEPVIQNYTRQILLGLSYLHGRNTVHRDIKGANILVDPNGEIKLADFGMAKHITSHSSMLSFKGSPYWMAPEVIMNVSGYNLAVDIWSLGCTILEMSTSKPPWGQYEGVAAIFKIGNSKDIPEIPDHLSNDAKNFLKLCLQRDPSARPSATKLLDHPFVRDQATTKVPKMNIISNDTFPSSLDGSHSPSTLDFHFNKLNISSQDRDKGMKVTVSASRAVNIPRDATRLNMSLPVSPCSSPLRQYGPAHRSLFLSPPHPSYVLKGQSSCGLNNQHPFLSPRQYLNRPVDQWLDISQPKHDMPGPSIRTRPM